MVVKRMLARIGCMLFAVLVLLNLAVTAYAQVNSGSLTLKAVSQTNGKGFPACVFMPTVWLNMRMVRTECSRLMRQAGWT